MTATDPNTLPDDVKAKLRLIRVALLHDDIMEAHHWLYAIACPSFQCYDAYAAIEGRQCVCGPHPLDDQKIPTADELDATFDKRAAAETSAVDSPGEEDGPCEYCGAKPSFDGMWHKRSCVTRQD